MIKKKNQGIILLKFIAALFITYSHMTILFPKFQGLVTGGAIGDGLFFFCSGFTLFLGRDDGFINWYKRRISRIYPTIIMWAIFSSIVFMWKWSITDIITTPRYWFIPCIMIYYAIFYLIRRYMFEHLKIVFFYSYYLCNYKLFYDFGFKYIHDVCRYSIHENLLFSFYVIRSNDRHPKGETYITEKIIHIHFIKFNLLLCMHGNIQNISILLQISDCFTHSFTNFYILDVSVL